MSDSITGNPNRRPQYLVNEKLVDEGMLPHMVQNRGFHFADGFFETIRVAHGKPQHLPLHFNRIIKSLNAHHIRAAENFNLESFTSALGRLIHANHLQPGGRIRVNFIRDGGGRYMPNSNELLWIAETEPLNKNKFALNDKGIAIDLYPGMKKPITPLANFKNIAASIYVQASIWAQENDLDDALVSNENDHVIESSHSNIFIVKSGALYTPKLEGGPVGGVMRASIINIALANTFKVYECNLDKQELLSADELFLSNAINGVQWVARFGKKRFYNKTAREFIRLINESLIH